MINRPYGDLRGAGGRSVARHLARHKAVKSVDFRGLEGVSRH